MKKYLSLIFKDLLLMKKYLLFTALIIFGVPMLFLSNEPIGTGLAAFSMAYILALYMTIQSLAYYESKYRKAENMLNCVPYSRHSIVISRYIILLLTYVVCLLVYIVLSLIIPYIATLTVTGAFVAFLLGNIMVGILQPMTYRFGIEKARYINVVILIGLSMGLPYLIRAVELGNIDLSFFRNIPEPLFTILISLFSIIILILSVIISINIYKKKEF